MLTQEVIDTLYRKFSRKPSSPDSLDIDLLFALPADTHNVEIDHDANLIINSISPDSPFHCIPLANIHAIVNFEDEVAIVLHSTLVILEKGTSKVFIHINPPKKSLSERLSSLFGRD